MPATKKKATPAEQPQAASAVAKQPRPSGNSIAQAQALSDSWRADEENARRDFEQTAWSRYFTLLARADSPEEGDARELADIMHDFRLTAEQLAEDRETIARARYWITLHQNRAAANQRRVELHQAHRNMVKMNREAERQAYLAFGRAETEHSQCASAAHELEMLARRRPQFFRLCDGVMQLIGCELDMPGESPTALYYNGPVAIDKHLRVRMSAAGVFAIAGDGVKDGGDRSWFGVAAERIEAQASGLVIRKKRTDTLPMVAAGPIQKGADVFAAADGKVSTEAKLLARFEWREGHDLKTLTAAAYGAGRGVPPADADKVYVDAIRIGVAKTAGRADGDVIEVALPKD